MPSTYTTRLRLTLPATGELTNTWGTTVNTGITELVDASIAGAATLSTWGGAGVAYTLSNNNGVTDEARCMFIVAAGSPGENKNIICPAVSKLYVVKNEVAGGFSVTLKTASGSGVTVENGKTAILRCTGTDVVDAITQLPAFSLAGGTVNGVVYLNASRTLTTSSALTFDGTTLTSTTYIKTGGGAASNSARLMVNTPNGSAAGIQLFQDAQESWIMEVPASSTALRWTASGTEYMRLTSTGLGIGTNTPTAKLHVVGNQFRQNDATGSQGYVINTTSATTTLATLFGGSSFAVQTGNSGTNQLLLDSSGNLGIGTSSPGVRVDASGQVRALEAGTGSGNGGLIGSTASADGNAGVLFQTNSVSRWNLTTSGTAGANLRIYNYALASTVATFDSSGNLGLGVTPSAWGSNYKGFELVGGGAGIAANGSNAVTIGTGNYINSAGNWIYTTTGTAVGRYELNSGLHRWYTAPSGTAGNTISFTQAMTLDASGNLGIGRTPGGTAVLDAQSDANGAIRVRGGTATNQGSAFYGTSGSDTTRFALGQVSRILGGTPNDDAIVYSAGYLAFAAGTVERARITSGGDLLVGTTSTGADGLGISNLLNLTFPEGSGTSYANLFRQTSSAATILANGYKRSATASGFASSVGTSWAKSAIGLGVSAGAITFYTDAAGTVANGTDVTPSERARITSGGDLLVGLSAATFVSTRLEVEAATNNNALGSKTTQNNYAPLMAWNSATTGDNLFQYFYTEGTLTLRGAIDYNRAGGLVRYNTTSDYRAKDIIGPVQNPGATIDALKVYEGKMKGATQTRPMLVAHEAQEVTPYAVSGVKDEVNPDGTPKFQQIDVSSLVPLLLAELQSLRARVAQLEKH